ncbi:MAG TPA: carbon-nitrogen hydrolase family protein [Clostridia bacterium]
MIIASAQMRPKDEDIDQNLQEHYRLIKLAADNKASLIVFPEMSITGYVRDSALELSFTENDFRLYRLRELAACYNMVIVAGAPMKLITGFHIGSFIIFPDGLISIYTKQFLHEGEDQFFVSNFEHNPNIKFFDEEVSFAICADINNPLHAKNANKAGATIYVPSIFYSNNGMHEAYKLLKNYAKEHSMNVLMSNYCGMSWGLEAGGKSAFWNSNGELLAGLDEESTGLVIGIKEKGLWRGMSIKAN